MRISLISEHASPLAVLGGVDAGGQNVHVAALAVELARHGVDVVVHTRRDSRDVDRRVAFAPGVVVDHVDAGPPAELPKDELLEYMPAFAEDLSRRWRLERPDLAHAHFWMSGRAAVQAARPLGIPLAQTFHALGAVKRRHQGSADTSPPQRLSIERGLVARVDHIVATCSDEVRELQRLGADTRKVTVVPCGVDTDLFTPTGAAEQTAPGRRRLVVVGRLVQRKGVDDVITALAKLEDTELVVAGGPAPDAVAHDPEAQRLRQLAAELGVDDRVDLRGRVEHDVLPLLLRSTDLVVCAPWYEPFGIVPLEAMACGVPVVGTAVGGLLDTVVHGETGLLVRPHSPDELADAIRSLLDDPSRRRAFGRAGAQRARDRYRWSQVAQETMAAYERMLAAHRRMQEIAL